MMDGNQLQQIKDVLLEKQQQHGRAGAMHVEDIEAPETQAEIVDIAQDQEQRDRDNSLLEQERRELIAVERALSKIGAGQFGTCEDCGDEIVFKRLLAVPEARLCAGCQAIQERQNFRNRPLGAAVR
jgi:DnaK suppressor protein